MKNLFYLLLLMPLIAKDIYFTRSGNVSFFSAALLEDIDAKNSQVTCVLDNNSGKVAFKIPIHGFTFKNALMQEHFNENYLESDKYPTAEFKGEILGWETLEILSEPSEVKLKGAMTIHGVTIPIVEKGEIFIQNDEYVGVSTFKITLSDYKIIIPKIVRDNIAKIVDVTVSVKLKKK
tara:strand:- start:640 stop:1173 length:534 start_codon:yes stop_codon:yes gene_type:complete